MRTPTDPGPAATPFLVVGVDRDPASAVALQVARDLAGRLGAWISVVHVLDLRDTPVDLEGPDWEAGTRSALAEHAATVRGWMRGYPGGWSYEVAHGHPATALARSATASAGGTDDALMIVLGHHASGPAAAVHHLLAGSTAHGLVRIAPCPVLLAPVPEA